MPYEWSRLGHLLLAPLTAVFCLWLLAGVCLLLRRQRTALALALTGAVGLWLASTPFLAHVLDTALDSHYAATAPQDAPTADAIVVLGGALVGHPAPRRPGIILTPAAGRVWHAAALYRAGKAPVVVVAAGSMRFAGDQAEADLIAEVLVSLGVPAQAIVRERDSRTTVENATNTLPLVRRLGARRVLLVTSSNHMWRAMATFRRAWAGMPVELLASPTDTYSAAPTGPKMWFPTAFALASVTKALKEYAGMAVLSIMNP
ncbi:YdcF family protein [Ramlibacter sp.]|uniref:YdcF family protein n=1 Tax=Ramlibacter sp. TaxID=1917967 RepID=UPI0017DB2CAD|nr:YdcF family protein [Ramlibacter sp.]MBA2672796.1 YdcF family protein [Ramlibacter sp.]